MTSSSGPQLGQAPVLGDVDEAEPVDASRRTAGRTLVVEVAEDVEERDEDRDLERRSAGTRQPD